MATIRSTPDRRRLVEIGPRTLPPVATVYRDSASDKLWHVRCEQELLFRGFRNGGLEVDFYCRYCRETVALTEFALGRVPVR